MRRKTVIAIILAFVMLVPSFAFAEAYQADNNTSDSDYYFETVIEDADSSSVLFPQDILSRKASAKTATKSKITYCKNSAGKVMWYVKVTGTFTYGNGSSKCTNADCTAEAKDKTWKVSNRSSSKSGNTASASAKGTHYLNGVPVETIKRTVTLKCSPTGKFS
jgi:hypothetical protein